MNRFILKRMLEQFFIEDIGDKDVSSELLFPKEQLGELIFRSKGQGIFAGQDIIVEGYHLLDENVQVQLHVKDGDSVQFGDMIATMKGSVQSLLKGERVILNMIQRMSGIATMTNTFVQQVAGTATRIVDTRKTTPGLRIVEKYAVTCGGGFNHRTGLYDCVMLKDNHIAFAGSIAKAVETVRAQLPHTMKIEIEVENEQMVKEAVAANVDILMFDNCTPDEIRRWKQHVPASIVTEASGGIGLHNARDYAEAGVDVISLGCLTHTITSLDISARVQLVEAL